MNNAPGSRMTVTIKSDEKSQKMKQISEEKERLQKMAEEMAKRIALLKQAKERASQQQKPQWKSQGYKTQQKINKVWSRKSFHIKRVNLIILKTKKNLHFLTMI